MGKRRREQLPGGDGDQHLPKTKPNVQEDSEAAKDDGLDVAEPAQSGDADGKPEPCGQATRSSAATTAPGSVNSDGEVAVPEQSTGGGKSPEGAALGAASQPESPQRGNLVADEAKKERHSGCGEEPATETSTHGTAGSIGDGPKCGRAVPAGGEGAAGGETALPADTPGRSTGGCAPAEMPAPHPEEGVNGDVDETREPPRTEENGGAVSERVAGGAPQECRQQPWASGTSDTGENVFGSCSGASVEVPVVCAPAAELKAEGGTAEAASTVGLARQPRSGNVPPWKTSGEAREEAGGGEAAFPGPGLAPAIPAGGFQNPSDDVDGLAEHTASAPRPAAQPPTGSGSPPRGRGGAESAPTVTVTPGPALSGTAQPPAVGTGSAVGASAGERRELQGGLEGSSPALPPPLPLPTTGPCGSVEPGQEPCAAACRSCAEEPPVLSAGSGPHQLWPRGEEPEGLCPPAPRRDATDVVCGLILELSNLNRLVMSAHRGLAALRRPKPRRSRQPARAERRWKET
ncbi:translation initiation factor IF-2-like [Falco biarmicus]|uniref:break repair meiotic recombinase recruitment factor 1 n=1 Tax=Falco cherrug TaxID=345164 RepID=UPI0024799A67|nr:break repair meiotic recombinase recruitment factor 1 [Falco cherrug]XP_056182210.1 translation initiation factor IF-2-like [Falco biarmicus]